MKVFTRGLPGLTGTSFFIILLWASTASCAASAPAASDAGSTPEGVAELVEANNRFAFELYAQFNEKGKENNLFFSPYSIAIALAMTYEGARGRTAEEMQSVLHIPEKADLRRPNLARIINEINRPDKKYKLSTANALWAQEDYKFLEEYSGTVEKYYGGRITNLDFVNRSEESRQTINTWVEDRTNKKIKDLIPAGVLNAYTRLVLTNAIYFKGMWLKPFDPELTRDEDFRTGSGQTVKVPMMRMTDANARFNYAENDELQVLEMIYEGDDLSMVILLPKEDKLAGLDGSLAPEKIAEWKGLLAERMVDVFIPRFKLETNYLMADVLMKMGMPSAFGDADFSGMDGSKSLVIQSVIHKAFVEVNEEGTEAAAATAVIVGTTSVAPPTPVFRCDHPFIFFIQQRGTGNILFLGRFCG